MITVPVPLAERAYEVHLGTPSPEEVADLLARALGRPTGVAVLVDATLARVSPRVPALTAALAARLPGVRVYELPAGEACKTMAEAARTCEWLAQNGYDRRAAIVGIGGGAASDHAGFVAAIYLRGVAFATCSTTVLGMVDASVGGKTGVDLVAGKNLVGAFHQPRAVVGDLGFLATLPRREQAAGMAEIIKAALIADVDLLGALEAAAARGAEHVYQPESLLPLIAAAVKVKVDVVVEDEREAGRRATLNFGHTLGHALEAASEYGLLHGEAVALGMVAALALGLVRGTTEPALPARATTLLAAVGLPVDVGPRVTAAVLDRIEVDKKRRSDRIGFVFVPRPGAAVVEEVALAELKQALPRALAISP